MFARFRAGSLCLAAGLLLTPMLAQSAAGEEKDDPILTFVKPRLKDAGKPFTLIVVVKVKEGEGAKFEASFAKAQKATRMEKGCISYDLNRDADDAGRYLVYERWKSLAALEAHLKTDHIKALLADLPALVAGAPEPRVLMPLGD